MESGMVGRMWRHGQGRNKEEKAWWKMKTTYFRGLISPSICSVPLSWLLWCAFMDCALPYQVNDVDTDNRTKGPWS